MTTANPYQAPKAELHDHEEPGQAGLAGRGQRFGAAMLDMLAWIIHEFSDAKAPLVVERRCETSDSPARRAFA